MNCWEGLRQKLAHLTFASPEGTYERTQDSTLNEGSGRKGLPGLRSQRRNAAGKTRLSPSSCGRGHIKADGQEYTFKMKVG
jgi:hypothetical protein